MSSSVFPIEVHLHLEWQGGEMRFVLDSETTMGEILAKVCREHGQDPLQYSMKTETEKGNFSPVASATTVTSLVDSMGRDALTTLAIKKG